MFLTLRKVSSEPLFFFTNAKMSVQRWRRCCCCWSQSHFLHDFSGSDVLKGQFAALASCLQENLQKTLWTRALPDGRATFQTWSCRLAWASIIVSGAQFVLQHRFFDFIFIQTAAICPGFYWLFGLLTNIGQKSCTYFFGDTDSSSMVDSSSPSKPKRSLLCFCRKEERMLIFFFLASRKLYWSMSG